MNYDRFINSKDIRDYLRQIGYSFTAPEAAFLVWQCRNATLKEKFAAWREIIETMPDCSLTRRKEEPIGSCHDFLRRHITSQETLLKEFPNGKNCVYRYETHEPRRNWPQDDGWRGGGEYFNGFDFCLSHCLRQLDEDTETDKIRFYRQEWSEIDGKVTIKWILETDREQNPVCADRCGIPGGDELTDTDCAFSDMWFAFPTPFKRGDLVWDPSCDEAVPFVLDYLNVWDTQEMVRQGLSPDGVYAGLVRNADKRVQAYHRTGCVMDMGAYGYGRREGFGIWNEFGGWANYLDLEYYPFELKGKDRVLRPVSEYLKGNCVLELLLNSYTALLLESRHGELVKAYQKEYNKDALQMVNIWPKQKNQDETT